MSACFRAVIALMIACSAFIAEIFRAGIADITLHGKVCAASSLLIFETYNVVAFLYLTMTLFLSGVVKWLENTLLRVRRLS